MSNYTQHINQAQVKAGEAAIKYCIQHKLAGWYVVTRVKFGRACWEEPQKIVDEFIVAGLTPPTRHSLNAYLLYKDFIKVGIEPDNWQAGSEFITTESIVVPYANKELDDSFVMWHGYEVNGFFSKEPEVVVLPGTWKVDKVTHSSYEEDVPYEDYTETIHVLNGLADLV